MLFINEIMLFAYSLAGVLLPVYGEPAGLHLVCCIRGYDVVYDDRVVIYIIIIFVYEFHRDMRLESLR